MAAYGLPRTSTYWRDDPITNVGFGEEIGPAYLDAVGNGDAPDERLVGAIEHYLRTDLEANFGVFYADIGVAFEHALLGIEFP